MSDVQSPRTDIDTLLYEALADAQAGVVDLFEDDASYVAALRENGPAIRAAREGSGEDDE